MKKLTVLLVDDEIMIREGFKRLFDWEAHDCGREAYKSTTCEAIEMEFGLLVIRNIPCYKCNECDEVFYTGDVVQKLEEITERVKRLMQEITIIDYAKAA